MIFENLRGSLSEKMLENTGVRLYGFENIMHVFILDSVRASGEKDHFFEQYRAAIQELCSLRYKLIGMPSIYIPTIVGNVNETSKSVSEETLRVLES